MTTTLFATLLITALAGVTYRAFRKADSTTFFASNGYVLWCLLVLGMIGISFSGTNNIAVSGTNKTASDATVNQGSYEKWKQFDRNPDKKALAAEFVDIGEMKQIPAGVSTLKVEFTCEVFCKDQLKAQEMVPQLIVSIENVSPEVLLAYNAVSGKWVNPFKVNAWNKMKYTAILKISDLKRMKPDHELKFYLWNKHLHQLPMRNFVTILSKK